MTDLFGTLSWPEVVWITANVVGLILAVAAMGEALMDLESVKILGRRGRIAGADVRARVLKANGNRRDEALKVIIHTILLLIGIIVAASPTPRGEYEAFAAWWGAFGIIIVAICLGVGSVYSLIDRRRLWDLFEIEADLDQTASAQRDPNVYGMGDTATGHQEGESSHDAPP